MIDQCAALALPKDAAPPPEWPLPELQGSGRRSRRLAAADRASADGRPAVALAPGAVGPSKRWPSSLLCRAGAAARCRGQRGLGDRRAGRAGAGGRNRRGGARSGPRPDRPDLRNAILALAAARAAVSNDSGLLHVAAAIGTPAIGIFGPTSPWHWAPLNPIAAVVETRERTPLPALPQAGLPPRPPPLHERDLGRASRGRDAATRWPRRSRPERRSAARQATRSSASITSATDGDSPLPPTTAIGPCPPGR